MSTATGRADAGSCCDDSTDARWGRLPGAEPPLRWWLPAAAFILASAVLTIVVVLLVRGPGPLDDPKPADQRDGLLLSGPMLPAQVSGVNFGGHPVVVLFERRPPSGTKFDAWRGQVAKDGVQLVVVVAVADADPVANLAAALRLPRPVDGGPPIGYAVVDASRTLRYSTLDPAYLDNAFEVNVITDAIRRARR